MNGNYIAEIVTVIVEFNEFSESEDAPKKLIKIKKVVYDWRLNRPFQTLAKALYIVTDLL